MSSFNNITKIKYNQNQSDPVALFEYVLCSDTENKKVVVFKFKNNMNQVLSEIKFEVLQYDENNNLIERVLVHHENFTTPEGSFFIPNAKLRVLENCVSVKTVLVFAKFERVSWSNNQFKEIPFTKNDFREEYRKTKISQKPVKQSIKSRFLEKVEVLSEKQQAAVLYRGLTRKKGFSAASTYKATRSKVAFWMTFAFSILLFLYLGISAGIFSFTSKVIFDGTFDYTLLSNTEASITDYEGKDSSVVIPTYYKDYKIVSIGEKAFDDSYITEITFTSPVTIEDKAFLNSKKLETIINPEMVTSIGYNAFEGCKSLTSVNFENATRVEAYAFKDCTNLKTVILPLATLEMGTFLNCTSLMSLSYDNTYQNSLKTLFNEEGTDNKPSVQYVYTNRKYIDSGYFDDCSKLTKIEFPKDSEPMFGFGALSGANLSDKVYDSNETCEVYYGEIVSFNDNDTKLIIPNSITRIEKSLKFIKNISHKITDLTIEYKGKDITFDKAFIGQFKNLEKVTIGSGVKVNKTMLTSTNIKEISLYSNYTYEISLPSSVKKLNILGDGAVNKSWFYGISNTGSINHLFIDKDVVVNSKALSALTNLTTLDVYNSSKTLDYMGVSYYLTTLNILLNEEQTTIGSLYASGYSKLSTINIPEGITYIGNNFIKENYSITEFTLPQTVVEVGLPLIGSGCNNLTTVNTHFVGSTLDNQCEYGSFNRSNMYTKVLNITGEYTELSSNFSFGCGSLKDLYIANITEYSKGCFKDLTSIKNLNIKINSLDSIGLLFGKSNSMVILETLNISVPSLDNSALQDAHINKLIISGECKISSDLLSNTDVNSIFFTKASSFGEYIDYLTFFTTYDGFVYIAEEFEYPALGYEERIRDNYDLDLFINK